MVENTCIYALIEILISVFSILVGVAADSHQAAHQAADKGNEHMTQALLPLFFKLDYKHGPEGKQSVTLCQRGHTHTVLQ